MLRHAPKLAVGGLLLALASGFFPLLLGEPPVSHRPAPGEHVVKIGALELFTPLVLDVGVFLLVVGRADGAAAHIGPPRRRGAAMILAFALAAAVLFGCGAYLLLKRDLRAGGRRHHADLAVRHGDDHRVQPEPWPGGHRGAAGRRRQRPAAPGARAHRAGDRAGHGGAAARPGAPGRHRLPHRRARRARRGRGAARGGTRATAPGGPGGDRGRAEESPSNTARVGASAGEEAV